MSIEDKIRNAKSNDWLTEGIPKWQAWLIVRWAVFKARKIKSGHRVSDQDARRIIAIFR